jgi:hypothetical protein
MPARKISKLSLREASGLNVRALLKACESPRERFELGPLEDLPTKLPPGTSTRARLERAHVKPSCGTDRCGADRW